MRPHSTRNYIRFTVRSVIFGCMELLLETHHVTLSLLCRLMTSCLSTHHGGGRARHAGRSAKDACASQASAWFALAHCSRLWWVWSSVHVIFLISSAKGGRGWQGWLQGWQGARSRGIPIRQYFPQTCKQQFQTAWEQPADALTPPHHPPCLGPMGAVSDRSSWHAPDVPAACATPSGAAASQL